MPTDPHHNEPPADALRPSKPNDQRRGVFVSNETFTGPVIGYQENHGGAATELPSSPAPSSSTQQAEVLLVTVTAGETRAVFDALQAQTGRQPVTRYQGNHTYYDLGLIGGARTWLVRSQMGTNTPGGALATVASAIGTVHPTAILMVGIAFGIDPLRQSIGGILIARQLFSYEVQRVGTDVDGQVVIIPRGDRAATSPKVLDRCNDGAVFWPDDQAQVQFGLVFSGDKLIDHAPTVAELLRQEPEAIGGEMEGTGLYVAATQHKVDWGLIKAVCDWADGKKSADKRERQALAARNAAQFTLHLLGRGGFAPEAWKD